MKRHIVPALLLTALLTACAAPAAEQPETAPTMTSTETVTPTPEPHWEFRVDDTHGVLEVPVGGKLRKVLITEAGNAINYEGDRAYYLVWNAYDWSQPIQVLAKDALLKDYGYYAQGEIVDVNFDGRMDFGYRYTWGSGIVRECGQFWIWNEEQGQFVDVPALAGIESPHFDSDTKVITSSTFLGRCFAAYKWINGELVCLRKILPEFDSEDERTLLHIWDWVDGNAVEVYHEETEWGKWHDLTYHGAP